MAFITKRVSVFAKTPVIYNLLCEIVRVSSCMLVKDTEEHPDAVIVDVDCADYEVDEDALNVLLKKNAGLKIVTTYCPSVIKDLELQEKERVVVVEKPYIFNQIYSLLKTPVPVK